MLASAFDMACSTSRCHLDFGYGDDFAGLPVPRVVGEIIRNWGDRVVLSGLDFDRRETPM
jgi:hypothetical protein